MKKKNNIQETMFGGSSSSSNTKTTVNVHQKDLAKVAKDLKTLGKDVNVNIVDEELDVLEPEAVIAPQDQATIKYLSNVKDNKTGEISQPFVIGAQKYQMIRGIDGDNQIVMAVFAHDETDDNGENIIYPVDFFEENIVRPVMEKLEMESKAMEEVVETKENSYKGRKHFLLNKKTNEVRSFSSIKEMLECGKLEEEEYMGISEFKKHMNNQLFGGSKRKTESLNEVTPTGEESDEEMNAKAKKLMDMIKAKLPNVIASIKTPVAQREVIAAFAELIGVPRNGLSNLVSGLKNLAKQPTSQPMNESVVLTKQQMMEMLGNKRNVIKTVKVKDLK